MSSTQAKRIRVLIVEDTRVVAEYLTFVLRSDPTIDVVGVARDGEAAVAAALHLNPDVITMDINMPKMDGFEATRRIMEVSPAPVVIVCGGLSKDEASINSRALEAGALAVVASPGGIGSIDQSASVRYLLNTVKLMSEVRVVRRWPRRVPAAHNGSGALSTPSCEIHAVVIGASTGGPAALQLILSGLPKAFPYPVLIVQHMTPGFVQGFVEWLGNSTGFAIRVATDGEPLLAGHAYVAPDDFHMGVRQGNRIQLTRNIVRHTLCPSVSHLFDSAQRVYGAHVIAILLTGMGRDGVDELKRLRNAGAITMAQDEGSSVVYGMPGEAVQAGAAQHVLSPQAIASTLTSIVASHSGA